MDREAGKSYNKHPRWLGPALIPPRDPRDAPLHRCIPLLVSANAGNYWPVTAPRSIWKWKSFSL